MLQGEIEQARRLRQEMSLPEIVLWRALQTHPGGFKFRKGHPAQRYTADIYCHEARLVVEVDGEAHSRGNRPERDLCRDEWFAERRIRVVRVTAKDVLPNLDGVVAGVVARAGGKSARPARSRDRNFRN